MHTRIPSLREHGSWVSLAAWLLLLGAVVFATSSGASASSLTGDSFIVSLACYNNPICPNATSANPVVDVLASSFQVQNAGAGFNFTVFNSLTQPIHGVFTNDPQELNIEFTLLQGFTTPSDIPAGGFLGLWIAASEPGGNPVQVLFSGTAGTTDGFTLADVSYAPDLTAELNFQGLTGSVLPGAGIAGNANAVLQLPGAAVPEPATWLLLGSGLLGLGWAQRRRVARHFYSGSLPLVARSAGFDSRQGPPAGAPGSAKLPPIADSLL